MDGLIFVWLLQYCGLLGFVNVGLGCYGSCLQLLRARVLFRLSHIGHPLQGILQLLVFIHLHLKGTTYTQQILNLLERIGWMLFFNTRAADMIRKFWCLT